MLAEKLILAFILEKFAEVEHFILHGFLDQVQFSFYQVGMRRKLQLLGQQQAQNGTVVIIPDLWMVKV